MNEKEKQPQNQNRSYRLYPEPKTYEDIKRDDKLRDEAYRRHWPKFPSFNIAILSTIPFAITVWFIQNLNGWWFGSSDKGVVMGVVFMSFALGMVLMFSFFGWVTYVNKLFTYFKGMVRLFWLVYLLLIFALFVVWLGGWFWHYTNSMWVLALTAIHFVVVIIVARLILQKS